MVFIKISIIIIMNRDMEKNSIIDRFNSWAKGSITLKLLIMGILILILLIPSKMIMKLIDERNERMNEAVDEISSKWGNEQVITGPIISVPYKNLIKTDKGEAKEEILYAHFLPEHLNINGKIDPQKRYRGIYQVVIYQAKLNITGDFTFPDFSQWNIPEKDILWNDAIVSIGIPDMRGIKDSLNIVWNGKSISFNPGIETSDIFNSGVSTKIPLQKPMDKNQLVSFVISLNLNGSKEIQFVPFGKITEVSIKSTWNSPKFDGSFLPETRSILDKGFEAKWKVLHLNRNFSQSWTATNYTREDNQFLPYPFLGYTFGVNLLLPVDEYQKTTRSAKYDIMFIFLTFLIFFFVEIINKKRIHMIQYLLVGFAITLFYVILLSLSEHISFNLAYLFSGLAIILLITFYSKSVYRSWKLALLTSLILSILYAFFFVILQLQDYALLFGSIGLFIVLAIVMYLSRNMDWYSVTSK